MGCRILTISSPAKVNLHLGVGLRRPDGYHDLDTVFHTLALCDILEFELHDAEDDYQAPDGSYMGVSLESEPAFDFPLEKNLIFKALAAYAQALDRPIVGPGEHLHIRIEKNIPAQAGLGGGSSNAAAALLALATFWGLDPLASPCLEVAGELGADVAFFLYGGCAYMSGKGEVMQERFTPLETPLLLVNTGEGVSTAAAYRTFDADPVAPVSVEPLLEALRSEGEGRDQAVADLLYNNLQPAAFQLASSLESLDAWLDQREGVSHLMSGSGSAFFVLCPDSSLLWPLMWEAVAEAPHLEDRPLYLESTALAPFGVQLV